MTSRVLLGMLMTLASPLQAQDLVFSPGILANSITNLEAAGSSIWIGPYLNVSHDGGRNWQAVNVDSLQGFINSVYSLDISNSSIWAGLGNQYSRTGSQGEVQTINENRGLLYSSDGEHTWSYRSPLAPADNDPSTTGILDHPADSLIRYGSVTLSTLPITVAAQAPPWDMDYDSDQGTLWLAGQLAGIRRSTDLGRTWERIVLPPDTTRYLAPELGYQFPFAVQPVGIPQSLFFGYNFQAFSVLLDSKGTVWAGTAGGLNRSIDDGVRWYHYTSEDGLLGNWVISIEEQPLDAEFPAIWATNWPGIGRSQRHGISVTRDNGASFGTALHGEKCYDFAFDGPRIYVACDRGLYLSTDDGNTFLLKNNFTDRRNPSRSMRPGASVYSVTITDDAIWVGSADGLFKSIDQGNAWQIFRTQVPLDPTGLPAVIPAEQVPPVQTYAYPNPFSPSTDRLVRLRYDLAEPQTVTIRIFDFGMNPVRELSSKGSAGANEVVWDGTDRKGARLANGPYFYIIAAQEGTYRGKILIIE